jgi:hypothetical protein
MTVNVVIHPACVDRVEMNEVFAGGGHIQLLCGSALARDSQCGAVETSK